METYYVRRTKKIGLSTKLDSPMESVVLNCVPINAIHTLQQIYNNLEIYCQKNKEKVPSYDIFKNWITLLIEKRFVIEVHGVQLQKLIDSL